MPLTAIPLSGERSRAGTLYEFLRQAILDGRLAPGERLVEETVAATASVSRTPVREAIRMLEADGLLENTGSGAVVVGVTTEQLAELCAVREALEGLASRLTALGRTDIDVLTLKDLLGSWQRALDDDDAEALVAINHAFHETIWEASGNRYLAEQLRTLRNRIELSQPTTLTAPGRAAQAMEEHQRVVDAIERRDAEAAEELAKVHFQRAMAIRLANKRLRSASSAGRAH